MKGHFNQELIELDITSHHLASSILETYGVCVIKNLLNSQECQELTQGMIDSLSYLTADMEIPFQIEKKKSWPTLDFMYPIRGMLYQHWSIGHSQALWNLRMKPKCQEVFQKLWESKEREEGEGEGEGEGIKEGVTCDSIRDLVVSFDGMSFHLPPEENRHSPGYQKNELWQKGHAFHTDQSFLKDGRHCIQGLVNGYDTHEMDATLVVLIGSHRYHGEYGRVHQIRKEEDWFIIKDISFFQEKGCQIHRIHAPKGSLVLWDSRTIHYGSGPLEGRQTPNYRAVVYLCYTPRAFLTEENRQKKIHYFKNLLTTNHWPHQPVPFKQYPRSYRGQWIPTKIIRPMPKPVITREYLYLIGFNEEEIVAFEAEERNEKGVPEDTGNSEIQETQREESKEIDNGEPMKSEGLLTASTELKKETPVLKRQNKKGRKEKILGGSLAGETQGKGKPKKNK